MKEINRFWVDNNNNYWDAEHFTEEEAEWHSKSLLGCYNCKNCVSCVDCVSCVRCVNCISCKKCVDCNTCIYCIFCTGCSDVRLICYQSKESEE